MLLFSSPSLEAEPLAFIFSSTKMEIHAGYMPISLAFNPKQVPVMLPFDVEYWVRKMISVVKHTDCKALLASVLKIKTANLSFKTDLQCTCASVSVCVCVRGVVGGWLKGGLILKMVITYLIACIMNHWEWNGQFKQQSHFNFYSLCGEKKTHDCLFTLVHVRIQVWVF